MAVIVVEKDIDRQLTIISVTGETTAEEITRTIVAHNSHEVTKLILWDLTKAMIQSNRKPSKGSCSNYATIHRAERRRQDRHRCPFRSWIRPGENV